VNKLKRSFGWLGFTPTPKDFIYKLREIKDFSRNKQNVPATSPLVWGFTLIEILIVMAILSIIITVVIVAINPNRQFALARNSARQSHVRAIVTATVQLSIDNRGNFSCPSGGTIPSTPIYIKTGVGGYNLCPCIIPTYLPQLVIDPSNGSGKDCSSYDTGYTIQKDASSGRITVNAPSAEAGETISMTY